MTANEIIDLGFSLAGESYEQWQEKSMALAWLNVSLCEALQCENSIRAHKALPKLENVPMVLLPSDNVDMDINICTVSLPFAIAGYVSDEREKQYLAQSYRNRFVSSLYDFSKGILCSIEDIYGGDLL